MDRQRTYSAREIEGLIAAGDIIVLTNNAVLRLDTWLDRHPGGRLAVLHMVGRDATDELQISHSSSTLKTMQAFRIGYTVGAWSNFVPPIRGGVYRPYDAAKEDDDVAVESSDSSDELSDSDVSVATSNTSIEVDVISSGRSRSSSGTKDGDAKLRRRIAMPQHAPVARLTTEAFIAQAVQGDIDASAKQYPSLDETTQRDITRKYHALHQRIIDEGYYDCRYGEYAKEMVRYLALFAAFVVCLRYGWITASACFLGLFWQQIMFTAHDAGHRGITHNFVVDTLIGIFIADLCCGMSIGWWKSSHNVHHIVTNMPEHDPDIQNVPLFATSPAFFQSVRSSYYKDFVFVWDKIADFTIKFQKYTYYPIMAVARFNLFFLSWAHLLSPRCVTLGKAAWTRPTEIAAILIYLFLFGYVLLARSIDTWSDRALFVLISHMATLPLHVQITLSHWGTSTANLGPTESFAQSQIRTTMDISCPEWLDFFHGGLQFQAVHHLFPRVPRHNLRRLQVLVREFCADTGIKYNIRGFSEANGVVLSRLEEVTQQARMMLECQAHMAATGESGLH